MMSRKRIRLIVVLVALTAICAPFEPWPWSQAAAPEFVYGMSHADDVGDWAWLVRQGVDTVLVSISRDGAGNPSTKLLEDTASSS